MFYRVCPHCGATLDPGEICTDCQDATRTQRELAQKAQHKKEAAPVQEHRDGPKGGNRFADQHFQLHDSKSEIKNQGGRQSEWVMSLI